jgi:hypothetical protein
MFAKLDIQLSFRAVHGFTDFEVQKIVEEGDKF